MEPGLYHQFLMHSALYAALSGRVVWSVIKNKVILIINCTLLAASLLSSEIIWVLCLKSLLKIMVVHISLDNFQTHCPYFIHSRLRAASHCQRKRDWHHSPSACERFHLFSSSPWGRDGSSCWRAMLALDIGAIQHSEDRCWKSPI